MGRCGLKVRVWMMQDGDSVIICLMAGSGEVWTLRHWSTEVSRGESALRRFHQ